MTLKPLKAKLLASKFVAHGFFGRRGGHSDGPYASLNCSSYVGDNPENVEKNLELVKNALNVDKVVMLAQKGNNKCTIVDDSSVSGSEIADAMATKIPRIAIGILSADCVPLLFFDDENMIIGAAHAGWHGALSGVLESTLEALLKLGAKLSNLKIALGPCIWAQSYEVSDDFEEKFLDAADCFCSVNSKRHFDLPKYCQKRLMKIGLRENQMEIVAVDTFTNSEDYFSYRAAKNGVCGRNISAIGLIHRK
ncbi:MAG: peptidoglycan editing factor PgeF [Holosporaceae bacterium]|jgi:YfiH family protein|nr:peptidoglycan editing factor PgeF [Holosporaceae bacterium]